MSDLESFLELADLFAELPPVIAAAGSAPPRAPATKKRFSEARPAVFAPRTVRPWHQTLEGIRMRLERSDLNRDVARPLAQPQPTAPAKADAPASKKPDAAEAKPGPRAPADGVERAPSPGRSGGMREVKDGVESMPVATAMPFPRFEPERVRADGDLSLPRVKLTAAEQRQLQMSGASTLLTEDANDAQANCLDRAVDVVRTMTPEQRKNAELVILKDNRPGPEGQTGHVVVRDDSGGITDPVDGRRYADTEQYLKANPHYTEAGTLPATKAQKIFETPPGSPERARALDEADVPHALKDMLLADPVPGPEGDPSLAARVKVHGPDILPDRAGSEAAGRADGERLGKALEAYESARKRALVMNDGSHKEAQDALLAEMQKLRAHAGDPAYAAALLEKVGKDKLRAFFSESPIGHVRPDDKSATPNGQIDQTRSDFGPLVDAFYTAEKSGLLKPELRQAALDLPPQALSRFLRLGPQDPGFARDAAKKILEGPPSPMRDGAVHDLLLSNQNPKLILELAAEEKYAKVLFGFDALNYSAGYRDALLSQLGPAFKADVPGSPLHQAAMGNMIKLAQDPQVRAELARNPQLSKMLAENFTPYLKHAAYLQAQDIAGNSINPRAIPQHNGPGLPADVDSDEIAIFFGGLVQQEGAREALMAPAKELLSKGKVAEYLSDPKNIKPGLSETEAFQQGLIGDLGLMSLVLQGIKVSGLDNDAKKKVLAGSMNTLFLGFATLPLGGAGPFVAVGVDNVGGLTGPKAEALATFLLEKQGLRDMSPEDYRKELKTKFAEAFRESLVAQNAKRPKDQQISEEIIKGIVNNVEAHFDSAILSEIEEIVKKLE